MNYDQIYKDTVSIVKSLVNGALAGGCNPQINELLTETYNALKEIAEQSSKDYEESMQPQPHTNETDNEFEDF